MRYSDLQYYEQRNLIGSFLFYCELDRKLYEKRIVVFLEDENPLALNQGTKLKNKNLYSVFKQSLDLVNFLT